MRRIVLVSWSMILAATAGGGVLAAQRMTAKPCTPEVSANLASLPPTEELPLAKGRIVALDPAAGSVTIDHRGIDRFYVEPGTTIFRIKDPTLLTGLTPGDKVRFDVEREGKRLSITRLENSN